MTWEQKLQACAAIGKGISLNMRAPGSWYVSHGYVSLADTHMETGSYGNGPTPEAAVEQHFKILTQPPDGKVVKQQRPGDAAYSYVRWNGFMWEQADRP